MLASFCTEETNSETPAPATHAKKDGNETIWESLLTKTKLCVSQYSTKASVDYQYVLFQQVINQYSSVLSIRS